MSFRLSSRLLHRFGIFALAASAAGFLAACQENSVGSSSRAYQPLQAETLALMEKKGTTKQAPVLIRAYKKEAEFEIWKMKADGRYTLLKTYPMCRWSGQLGPKLREGDRQVPEGFYTITPGQMNPNSAYYLSFNVGYPNAYDRAYGRTGGSIMVHGACSSAGCFSMTDQQIAEIYAIAREGFAGGQRAIQMQSMPFRMTAENLAKHRADPNIAFWKQLKEGADNFEVTKQEVAVGVCNKHYVFNASAADGSRLDASSPCPPLKYDQSLRSEIAAKEKRDAANVADLAAEGVRPVKVVYTDGGQHPDFTSRISDVSRPDALAQGPVEIALDEGKGKKGKVPPLVQMASAKNQSSPVQSSQVQSSPSQSNQSESGQVAVTKTDEKPVDKPVEATHSNTSILSRFFGPKQDEQPAAEPVDVKELAVPQPAKVPLPPRRQAAETIKPHAKLEVPNVISGAPAPVQQGFAAYTAIR